MLLDITVEETLTKIGFRYVVQEDWGRLRRLFARCVQLKVAGGLLAARVRRRAGASRRRLFDADDLFWPVLVSALLPLVASVEGVGLAALLLRRRYDIRGSYQAVSGVLRLAGIAVGAQFGVTGAVVGIVRRAGGCERARHACSGCRRFAASRARRSGRWATTGGSCSRSCSLERRHGRHLAPPARWRRSCSASSPARRRSACSASRSRRRPGWRRRVLRCA